MEEGSLKRIAHLFTLTIISCLPSDESIGLGAAERNGNNTANGIRGGRVHRMHLVKPIICRYSASTIVPMLRNVLCCSSTTMQRHSLHDNTVVLAVRRAELAHVGNLLRPSPDEKRELLAEGRRHEAEEEEIANFTHDEQCIEHAS